MLSGKPIIASYTGFPSMINEAGCGSFVPAGDANAMAAEIRRLQQLIESERREIGKKGREWILKNRRYASLAADYLEICRRLVGL
jgi:glycosyltransferase involved in cell wall biosynthesis